MSRPTDEEQIEKFQDALRSRGGAAGNGAMRSMLGWSEAEYWRIRDCMMTAGLVTRGRGQGGSVQLVENAVDGTSPPSTPPPPPGDPFASEDDLYEPCSLTLRTKWAPDQGLEHCYVQETARQGRRATGGVWTRPDVIAISMRTFMYWPGRYFDLWTFEIKPRWAVNVAGIYETAAHSRSATNSYCLFHVRSLEDHKNELERLVGEAQKARVGIIFFTDPLNYDTWDFRVEPVRTEPDPALLEEFVATQLDSTAKKRLIEWGKR